MSPVSSWVLTGVALGSAGTDWYCPYPSRRRADWKPAGVGFSWEPEDLWSLVRQLLVVEADISPCHVVSRCVIVPTGRAREGENICLHALHFVENNPDHTDIPLEGEHIC